MPGRRVSQTPSLSQAVPGDHGKGAGFGLFLTDLEHCATVDAVVKHGTVVMSLVLRLWAHDPQTGFGRTPREGSERRSRGPRTSKRHSSGGSTRSVLVAACTLASRRAAASSAEESDRLPHRPWHGPPASVQPVPGPATEEGRRRGAGRLGSPVQGVETVRMGGARSWWAPGPGP